MKMEWPILTELEIELCINDVKENEYNEEEYLTDVLKEKIIM